MKRVKVISLVAIFLLGAAAISSPTDRYFDIMKNIEIFSNVYKELNTNYVDDLDPSQLMRTGIDAIVNSLDPYTNYISESQIESYRLSSEGNYNGVGAMSRMIDGWVTIVEVYEGGSAQEAGIIAGDRIISVDGNSTQGRSNDDVLQILRGSPGSNVKLGLNRPGVGKLELELERSEINIPNVPFSEELSDDVGYIALTSFTPNAGKNVADKLRDLKRGNPNLKGVILDLRGNGGGLLSEALNVSNVFVPKGKEIVTTKGKVKDRDQTFRTRNAPVDLEIPLVVLVNKRSASASEIVCGVMQDYDRGVLLGQRTYGKGLVQNTLEVGYNSRLKVTISKYYIPSGRCIQSVEYENGEPKDISDDRRAVFHTNNGRSVLDGGGVAPDVKIDPHEKPGILLTLEKDNLIFNYVTEFCLQNQEIPELSEFEFDLYDQFKKYLEDHDFKYVAKSEKMLEELKHVVERDSKSEKIKSQINSLEQSIAQSNENDLDEYKVDIVRQLESEIITRYYFQKGKVEHLLKNDREVLEAIALLNDQERYRDILSDSTK